MATENTVQFKEINFAEKLESGSEPELKIVNKSTPYSTWCMCWLEFLGLVSWKEHGISHTIIKYNLLKLS